MVELTQIKTLTEEIVRHFRPEKIILFGSYGYGTPTADSDVDLLVVLPFVGKCQFKSLEILEKTNPTFAVDLITRTPEQVQARLRENDFFMKEIISKGKVLYGKVDA
jgi:uncharacterized protein